MAEANDEFFDEVKKVIEEDIKPFIEADGGRIVLKRAENGIVYVSLSGACAGCPGSAMTLRGGVERILKMKIKEVKAVKLVY
ncbi:MAG: NifU family protein [Candidatus Kapaibacteriota bacterium]|jgi:Fe-S cluster biogenesis protein NfuA